ncbi:MULTISPECIES: hypothetical protein [unclassified Pseudomonas]|uniref:hypothetical protein n=1 Tax=unclassified Pseudomonas TaxID=196821 RepID=UPI000C86AA73|nr:MULTISPECIES: hypothetical protein [unclassified Pseudomonas]PMV96487.1 hypothetical protein C1X55_19335 [Pseudomonas sp. GW460-C8]PMW23395.1 hypothetical protein C1X53_12635 [Pseudomonas sp. GW456-E6]PMW24129.1 hypothetical protein C1X40_04750 [Pseudomonas sp. GW456-11-11-14-TSB2]PMW40023.1 hypothetical protein C1X45_08060 [Pseudomonas sp. GW460-7]PMW41134.1 hypothetical protein C1X48_06695 [Pseudomonas sp. FW305-3-2-15-A-R2A1]
MQNAIKTLVSHQEVLDGFDQSKLPIDRDSIRSRRLLRMIELVEVLRTPDNQRTMWQLLLDAGANPDYILMRDCDDDVQNGRRPAIQVRVNTCKHRGFVVLGYDADDRGFKLLLQDEGTSIARVTVEKVNVRKLAEVLEDLVDDGTRRLPQATTNNAVSSNAAIQGDYLLRP